MDIERRLGDGNGAAGQHEFVILDPCDGRTPFVVRLSDLGDVRVFDPDATDRTASLVAS